MPGTSGLFVFAVLDSRCGAYAPLRVSVTANSEGRARSTRWCALARAAALARRREPR